MHERSSHAERREDKVLLLTTYRNYIRRRRSWVRSFEEETERGRALPEGVERSRVCYAVFRRKQGTDLPYCRDSKPGANLRELFSGKIGKKRMCPNYEYRPHSNFSRGFSEYRYQKNKYQRFCEK